MLVKTKIRFLFFAFFLAALLFTTCDTPMGMGLPIDWEPPVLTLDPKPPTPMYVREGAQLTGLVTDNIAVDRVILRDQATGNLLFTAELLPNDRWRIDLVFTEEQNGETILADVVAYDKAGNSDARSIATVVLYIDIRPPVIKNISISRTETRPASLESYMSLYELETLDPRGEKKDNLYKYQNGWFYINGIVEEEETRIEVIALNIYDKEHPDTLLLSIGIDDGYSSYSPRWTVKEDDIIAAGVKEWGENYKTDYYANNARYYYRVSILAIDKSGNESIEEDEGYICMWAKSDEPKGILDPSIGTVVSRGTPLPVDFFDDDSLLWAYTGLLTEDQWNGIIDIALDVKIPPAYTDSQKLSWLKERLTGAAGDSVILGSSGSPVYNWKYDKNSGVIEPIEEQIKGAGLDEKLVYVNTGNSEEEYGDYVLFTLAADKKLSPHSGTGHERTNRNIWSGQSWHVSVVDENIPLIVFDTTNGCPEENTFPELTGGESFVIKGYTLRENGSGNNSVTTFRMAWIPFGMDKGADNYIPAVQRALSASNYPYSINSDTDLSGIQHWEFRVGGGAGYGSFGAGVDDDGYNKQDFQKTFNVLGAQDDIITGDTAYQNFFYNSKLENETKLFVFFAMDSMGHEVFRQLRLLGMKTPPDLAVYDISNEINNDLLSGLPNPNAAGNVDSATGGVNSAYYSTLNAYNSTVYTNLKTAATSLSSKDLEDKRTIPFQIYPRESILKYWVIAEKPSGGDIAVRTITMKDISYSTSGREVGSGYRTADRALSFCEYYPDVTQRTFLFEAEDMLGNVARIQRTIAVTNAARLENITTTEQTGTYGIGKTITLTANFSSQIYLGGTGRPSLNIRYHDRVSNTWRYQSITTSSNPTQASPALSLDFNFTVLEGMDLNLETMWETIDGSTGDKRPITLNTSTIMDYIRKDAAFIPGYKNESVIVPNWTTAANSLQAKKAITLDGRRPIITSTVVGGKTAWAAGQYYFRENETIEFTLTSDKLITASEPPNPPRLRYQIRRSDGTLTPENTLAFTYSKPGGSNSLVFSLPVTPANCPSDGELVNVNIMIATLYVIKDNVGNTVDAANNIPVPTSRVFIKINAPEQPAATLNTNAFGGTPNNSIYFATGPSLAVSASTNTFPSYPWEDKIEYTLNGGLSWTTYTAAATLPAGTHRLQVRYEDRAGNKGAIRDQAIQVGSAFPKLTSVSVVQPSGWYTSAAGKNTLNFNLNFDDRVTVNTAAQVTITLTNKAASNTSNPDGDNAPEASYQKKLQATVQTNVTSIAFTWNITDKKEMQDGLYISAVDLTGLRDAYNNSGPASGASTWNGVITIGGNTCPNLPSGIKVDSISPKIDSAIPALAGAGVSSDNRTITLVFNEPVLTGSGVITVRPYGDYRIPAVLENNGYYLGTDGIRYAIPPSSGVDTTWIAGFYDIYNALSSTTDRNNLTAGESMSKLSLDERTGQSAGPYMKITHGLKDGPGYTGNYTAAYAGNGPNPDTGSVYMVPDTATKWVLDYKYSIDNANNTQWVPPTPADAALATPSATVVPAIRTALTNAKWRWQEIDIVTSTTFSADKKTVTIKLNEPLLAGLQWGLTIPEGAFTDMAGNKAAATGDYNANGTVNTTQDSTYWFWSSGAQAPVIRVNRKSFDARTTKWSGGTVVGGPLTNPNRTYAVPSDRGGPGGWGIGDFNTVHYRVETETPGAIVYYNTVIGNETDTNRGSVTAAWDATTIGTSGRAWNNPGVNVTQGEWVLPNLIRRSGASNYTVTENGFNVTRTMTANYQGYRSYNRDILKATLTALPATNGGGPSYQGSFTYAALQASKNYVVAEARVTNGTAYTSAKSYEGVFRSVVALNQNTFGGNLGGNITGVNPIMVEGSNVKNGMPSIAGFPLKDAEDSGDNRFIKLFYNITTSNMLYWVSTEIVSQWYELNCGRRATDNAATGGTHQGDGEINNYLSAGYGDLTYSYNQR
jgi:hypothetical protein